MSDTEFNKALEKYYELKNQYEEPYKKMVKKLQKDTRYTLEEKQKALKDFRTKCVGCNSKAGSIFTQEGNILIARCGNQGKPCKLNLRLQKGKYETITKILNDLDSNINDIKNKTIKIKLNFLFGFSKQDTTIKEFNGLKTQLIQEAKNYQDIHEKYLSIVNNLTKKKEIFEQNIKLSQLVESFKELIKKFEDTQEPIYLQEAMKLYIENITVSANMIRKLKYVYNKVEIENPDVKPHVYELIQKPYTQSQLQELVPGTKNAILK